MLLAPVMTMPIPSMREFCMLAPCMPRVCGRSTSEPCCSWKPMSGRYREASLKLLAWLLAISDAGSTFTM